jgi:hypothetical protein
MQGGVDTFDKIIRTYTCKRRTKRWPSNSFMFILDAAAYNAFVLYSLKNPGNVEKNWRRKRRDSIQELALSLIKPYILIRKAEMESKNYKHVHKDLLHSIEEVGIEINKGNIQNQAGTKSTQKGSCSICNLEKKTNVKDRSRVQCSKCKLFVCKEHRSTICTNCEQ